MSERIGTPTRVFGIYALIGIVVFVMVVWGVKLQNSRDPDVIPNTWVSVTIDSQEGGCRSLVFLSVRNIEFTEEFTCVTHTDPETDRVYVTDIPNNTIEHIGVGRGKAPFPMYYDNE